ncbi:DMT family transporter [Streptomyces chartreusis]|uniref:DMT family transporter n=1 Tax=Streptomyces chartreusis TaxID=1969 RepID=UPI003438051D
MTPTRAQALLAGRREYRVALVALACASAVWGWSYIVVVWLLPEMGAGSMVAVRFLAAGALLVLIRPRAVLSIGRRTALAGALPGLCLGSATLLQTEGQRYLQAAQSGFLASLFVVLTPLVAWAAFRVRVTPAVWAAVVVATAGLAVISYNGVSVGIGSWLTLAGALGYAVQMVLLSQFAERSAVYGMTAVQLLTAGLIASVGLLGSGLNLPDTWSGWAWLAYLTVMATLFMYGVQTWAQARVPAAATAVVMACEPLFVSLFSFLIGSPPGARTLVGGAFIVTAMYLVLARPTRGTTPSPVNPTGQQGMDGAGRKAADCQNATGS